MSKNQEGGGSGAGVGVGRAGVALRVQRSPRPGPLVGVGDQEVRVGQLSPELGPGDSKPAAWIPAESLAWCLWASRGTGSLCTDRTPPSLVGSMAALCKAWEETGGSYPDWQGLWRGSGWRWRHPEGSLD